MARGDEQPGAAAAALGGLAMFFRRILRALAIFLLKVFFDDTPDPPPDPIAPVNVTSMQ